MVDAAQTLALLPVATLVVDREGLVRAVNPAFCELLGLPEHECVGHPLWEVTGESREAFLPRLEAVLAHPGRTEGTRDLGRRAERRTIRWSFQPDAARGLVVGTGVDVTAETAAHRALEASEARFKLLFDAAPEALTVFDLETFRIVDANQEAQRLFQRSLEELRVIDPGLLVPLTFDDGRPMRPEALALMRAAALGAPKKGEFGALQADGSVVPVEFNVARLPDSKPRLRCMLIDLRGRRQAEINQRLSELTAQIDGALFELERDPDGPFEMKQWSAKAPFYLGQRLFDGPWAPEVLFGSFVEEDAGEIRRALDEGRHNPAKLQFEARARAADGTTPWVHIAERLHLLPNGHRLWRGVITDITQRKALEASREEALRELARVNQALVVSNKELEAFSYSVSHDLRAPLRHIDGFSRALEEDCGAQLSPDGLAHLARIRGATLKMGQLIDDLLKLSKVTRFALTPVRVDLTSLVQELFRALAAQASGRVVHFTVDPELWVMADAELLRIVFTNLLDNALKYTSKRPEARIEVRGHRQAHGLEVSVRDDGAGFDPRYADKLFNAFQRLHRATDFPGTGVGLATVQRIVARHGGTTRAEGQVGQGATFTLWLPDVSG